MLFLRLLFLLLIPSLAFASAPDRPSGSIAVPGVIISSQAYNNDLNTIYTYLQNGVDTVQDGSVVNVDIATNAAIAYSKLNLTNSIVNADVNTSAAIVDTKLAQIVTAGKASGSAFIVLGSIPSNAGIIPTANLGTGTANAGTFLRGDQTWATALATSQIFIVSGTFATPSGINKVYLSMAAGGGGGAGAGSTGAGNSGAGGAGGAVLMNYPFTVVPGNNYTVTIGAAGTAGTASPGNGGNGGDTSFDSLTVTGGVGGNKGTNVGGTGVGGTNHGALTAVGTVAGNKFAALSGGGGNADVGGSVGGAGGATVFGDGGAVGSPTGASASANTGAGGGGATASVSGGAGGAGGSGICIVSY